MSKYRTHNLGELRKSDIGKEVTLSGWVLANRDFGGLTFIDLRDRYGKTQIVFDNEVASPEIIEMAQKIRPESVITIMGEVRERQNKNPNIPTGDIEVFAHKLKILNEADVLPFQVSGIDDNLGENARLTYRYLDMRRPKMLENLKKRHKMVMAIRKYMDEHGFIDVDTPLLNKSTPEGARDFLVPCRINPNTFYALPQSPQIFKQLLMIAGIDKYFQIAKCFRDEDLRADRQFEFTQLDVEMSFVEMKDVMRIIEGLAKYVFREVVGEDVNYTFPRITYNEAMERYGSDKPDTRFGVELHNISDICSDCGFNAFKSTVQNGGIVACVVAPQGFNKFSRKVISEYENYAKTYFGAKGMAYIKIDENGKVSSPIAKFLTENEINAIIKESGAKKIGRAHV